MQASSLADAITSNGSPSPTCLWSCLVLLYCQLELSYFIRVVPRSQAICRLDMALPGWHYTGIPYRWMKTFIHFQRGKIKDSPPFLCCNYSCLSFVSSGWRVFCDLLICTVFTRTMCFYFLLSFHFSSTELWSCSFIKIPCKVLYYLLTIWHITTLVHCQPHIRKKKLFV